MENQTGIFQRKVGRARINLRVATAFPLLICINEIPIRAFPAGTARLRFRTHDEHDSLTIQPTELKKPYGVSLEVRNRQKGETLDDLPPPQPVPPDNYLAMVREKVRQSMGINRENFADDDRPSIYEVPDDADLIFEETEEDRRKEAAKAAKAKKEAEDRKKSEASERHGDDQGDGKSNERTPTPQKLEKGGKTASDSQPDGN